MTDTQPISECPKCGALGSQAHAPGCSGRKRMTAWEREQAIEKALAEGQAKHAGRPFRVINRPPPPKPRPPVPRKLRLIRFIEDLERGLERAEREHSAMASEYYLPALDQAKKELDELLWEEGGEGCQR